MRTNREHAQELRQQASWSTKVSLGDIELDNNATMRARGDGPIINIGSILGRVTFPFFGVRP
jgi:hypothetical protein